MTTNKNSYPFISKNEIKARLESDAGFAAQCILIMQDRQTSYEQETSTTKDRNRRGWMSSHAVFGGKIARQIRSFEEITPEDRDRAIAMVSHYTKQLASHFRGLAVDANPELAKAGALFGV